MSLPREPRILASTPDALDADVLVVGYGPVGQSLAALLGVAGHRVTVRAAVDALRDASRRALRPRDHAHLPVVGHRGRGTAYRGTSPAVRVRRSRRNRGIPAATGMDGSVRLGRVVSHFYQPELEDVLDAAVHKMSNVDVRFGAAVVDLRQESGHVVATLADGSVRTARYATLADGANSAVRALCDIGTEDLGFRGDWLVVDVRPRPDTPALDIPDTCQVLNPARPNHMGRVAQRYFRWEFMLVDGDDPSELVRPERVWELLEPWVGPEDAELIRQTVYQFRSIMADTFRRGSVLLAGDAAHVMPPFLGQGMSSGIRDAATLGWMFDLVLTGAADPELLDLYTASRRPHVLAYIEESVRIGTVVCETDPVRAAQRREDLRSATELPSPFEPPIGAGLHHGDPLAGQLAVQPLLRTNDGKTERSDDVLGHGFTLFSLVDLDPATRETVSDLEQAIGLRSIVVGAAGVPEEGAALRDWLREAGVVAVLVRPDFSVFGTAEEPSEVPGLLGSLRASLSLV